MTLLQKINPFSRPPSRLSRNSVEHSARPSSSLEGIAEVDPSLGQGQTPTPAARANPSSDHVAIPLFQDPHPETALSNRSTQQRSQPQNQILQAEKSDLKRPDNRTLTPQPHTPRQHKKTPSILRSLAHHPSFSALKSKSRRRKEKEAGRLVGRSGSEGVDVPGASGYVIESGDLRGSRSVPGGLRLSEELAPPVPGLPSPSLARTLLPNGHPLGSSRYSSSRNIQTPSINVQHHDMGTPDSIKVTRMRLELEIESPTRRSPSRMDGLGPLSSCRSGSWAGSSPRSGSINERYGRASTTTPVPWPERLTATGGSPGAYPSPPRLSAPPMLQRTPRRQASSSEPSYDLSPHLRPHTERHDHGDDPEGVDFEPVCEDGSSGITPESKAIDDALDLFVVRDELPMGTPGGSKADLRRGALVDGARHERGAIRFFSRDTYKRMSSETSFDDETEGKPAVPSTSINSTIVTATAKSHSRRSSSPFEIKLTPVVSKRISLDAFGTSPLNLPDQEELLEDEGVGEMEYHGNNTLSTIDESPSSGGNSSERSTILPDASGGYSLPRSPTPEALDAFQTHYYTPTSSSPAESHPAFSPFIQSRYVSAHTSRAIPPPIDMQDELAVALQNQLVVSGNVIAELQAEARKLRDAVEEEVEEKRKALVNLTTSQREAMELEKQVSSEQAASAQLQAALHENESHFDRLHFDMEEALQQKVMLQTERDSLLRINRSLQERYEEIEKQLEATGDDYAAHLANHQGELREAQRLVLERDVTIAQLRGETGERIDSLKIELKAANLAQVEQEATIEMLKDKLREARFEANERRFQGDAEIDRLQTVVEERDAELKELEEEIKRLELEKSSRQQHLTSLISARDEEITNLRGQLNIAEAAKDEVEKEKRDLGRSLNRARDAETELRDQVGRQNSEVESAILRAEEEATRADGLESRLTTFLDEIGRLQLSETSLKDEVGQLRARSASDEVGRCELEKRIKQLEEDKELLNVALESKQMELTLVQRRNGNGPRQTPSTPTTSRSLASSTSRVHQTPSTRVDNHTPLATRHLASSVSAVKAARRGSSLIGETPSTARSTRTALSAATHHNQGLRTPEKQKSCSTTKIVFSTTKAKAAAPTPSTSAAAVGGAVVAGGGKQLERRSSLPVLVRKPSVIGQSRQVDGSLLEEDENGFA